MLIWSNCPTDGLYRKNRKMLKTIEKWPTMFCLELLIQATRAILANLDGHWSWEMTIFLGVAKLRARLASTRPR